MGFLGLDVDDVANAEHGRHTAGRITVEGTDAAALVVPTDEELMIALDTLARLTS